MDPWRNGSAFDSSSSHVQASKGYPFKSGRVQILGNLFLSFYHATTQFVENHQSAQGAGVLCDGDY